MPLATFPDRVRVTVQMSCRVAARRCALSVTPQVKHVWCQLTAWEQRLRVG